VTPAIVLFAFAGCASTLPSTSARTLAPGRYEFSGALGTSAAGIEGGARAAPLPVVELGVRRGITDDVDLGVKLFEAGAQLDAKLQLRRRERGWSLSLAPGVGYLFAMTPVATTQLALYAGYVTSGGHELLLAPNVMALFGEYDRAPWDIALGTSIGFALRASAKWKIMPQVSASRTMRDPVWGGGGGVAVVRSW